MTTLNSSHTTIDGVAAVPIEQFGKDHWSLLCYIGCRVESHPTGDRSVGALDKRRLRCNEERHTIHNINGGSGWLPEYGSRLASFWKIVDGEKTTDPSLQIPYHDDWDCLDDLEAAGLVEVLSEANAYVKFTECGLVIYGELRRHKAAGNNFASFRCGSVCNLL